MNKTELIAILGNYFPDKQIEDSFGFPTLRVEKEKLEAVSHILKQNKSFGFNQLVCETAVDRSSYFELVCHLRSTEEGHEMILKTRTEREGLPTLPSLYGLWQIAELFEDEIYDLFGIRFENHPNLRRLFLDESFEGHPLRKDFVNKQEL